MPRSRIFVSYSHKDDKPFEQLQRFLRPLERAGRIDLWVDTRLAAGEDWQAEIERALKEATAVVLLISQDFLNSEFIQRRELPPVVARAEAGKLTLIPVFLSPSSVKVLEIPYLDASSGKERRIKLSKYQGYGTPTKPLSEYTWSDRERIYEKLVERLLDLAGGSAVPAARRAQRTRPAVRSAATVREPARAYELTVELTRDGDVLQIRYHLPGREPIASAEMAWGEVAAEIESLHGVLDGSDRSAVEGLVSSAAAGCGQVLFRTLFGPATRWGPILRQAFGRPAEAPRANPSFAPLRLRICTVEPLLIGLPWRLIAWNGRLLAEDGWVIASTSVVEAASDVTTTAPSSVLILAPGSGPDSEHPAALIDLLADVWPTGQEAGYVRIVKTRAQLANALKGMRPHLLYVYARGELAGERPSLVLDGEGGEDLLELARLGEMFEAAGHRPEVIYLNVAGSSVTPSGIEAVPLVVWRRLSGWESDSTTRGVAWLRRWLGKGVDPVTALHPESDGGPSVEAATLVVHASYRTWKTATFRLPARQRIPRLRLDRDKQKALVRKHVAELARSDSRRVMALVAYAEPGNAIAALHEQLRDYLDLELIDLAEINWRHLEFPDARAEVRRDLEHELDLQLGADSNELLAHLLRRHAPTVVGTGKRAIVWLDWGVFGAGHQPPLSARQLGDWLRFSSEYLGTRCPDDLRLVSYLAIETESAKHKRLARALQEERRQPWNRRQEFRLSVLPSLGQVPEDELLDFLEDPGNSSCDPAIQAEIAERVIADTGGDFEPTIALMEEAEKGSWYDLLARLRREQGAEPPDDDTVF